METLSRSHTLLTRSLTSKKVVKLSSLPVVDKILVANDIDKNDVYGFEVNQNYKCIQVAALSSREFVYSGGWLGGYGPHGQGELEVFEYGDITISEIFDRGSFIIENLPKKFVLRDGSIDPIYFVTQYRHREILKTSYSEYEVISKCYVNVFTGKISIAMFSSDSLISNMKLYMNGKMQTTDVQSPLTYSGKFDWETRTQLSGSINGSSVIFSRAVSYVNALKDEYELLCNMAERCKDSQTVFTLRSIDDVIELKSLLFQCDYKLLHRIYFEYESYVESRKHYDQDVGTFLTSFQRIINQMFFTESEKTLSTRSTETEVSNLSEFTYNHKLNILAQEFNDSIKPNETTWYHVEVPTDSSKLLYIHFTPPSNLYMKLRKAEILNFTKDLNVR